MSNEKAIKKALKNFTMFIFLLGCDSADEQTLTGTLICGEMTINAYKVKKGAAPMEIRRTFNRIVVNHKSEQHQLSAGYGSYLGYAPQKYKRTLVTDSLSNVKDIFHIDLNSIPKELHTGIKKCLLDRRKDFDNFYPLYAKNHPLKKADTLTDFVFWEDKRETLEEVFVAASGERIQLDSRTWTVVYHLNDKQQTGPIGTKSVGSFYLKGGMVQKLKIDFEKLAAKPTSITPIEKNPKKYLYQGKHMGAYYNTKILAKE